MELFIFFGIIFEDLNVFKVWGVCYYIIFYIYIDIRKD